MDYHIFSTESELSYEEVGRDIKRETIKFIIPRVEENCNPISPDYGKHTLEKDTFVVDGPAVKQLFRMLERHVEEKSKATGFYKITSSSPGGPVKVYDPDGHELSKILKIEISPLVPGELATAKIEVPAVVDLIVKEKK